jgi:CRISPR/Cas system-associated endonuclease Cas1
MSGHLALVVDQAGATLEAGTHETLVLVNAAGRRERVGLRALGSVILQGAVKFDTGVLQALTSHNVALSVLTRAGRSPALGFTPLPHRHVCLRHRQHLAYADPARRLALARAVLVAKLEAMRQILMSQTNRPRPAGQSSAPAARAVRARRGRCLMADQGRAEPVLPGLVPGGAPHHPAAHAPPAGPDAGRLAPDAAARRIRRG